MFELHSSRFTIFPLFPVDGCDSLTNFLQTSYISNTFPQPLVSTGFSDYELIPKSEGLTQEWISTAFQKMNPPMVNLFPTS